MGRKFTIFALSYFVFEGKFQVQAPRGPYIRRGDWTEGFLRYDYGGLIFGAAYTRRGLFSEFYGTEWANRMAYNPHNPIKQTSQSQSTLLEVRVNCIKILVSCFLFSFLLLLLVRACAVGTTTRILLSQTDYPRGPDPCRWPKGSRPLGTRLAY